MRMDLLIFGRPTTVTLSDSRVGEVLANELSSYPTPAVGNQAVLTITEVERDQISATGLRNPSSHLETSAGFVTHFGDNAVEFVFDGDQLRAIKFSLGEAQWWGAWGQKLRSMQYTSSVEMAGQFFHEFVLIPAQLFDPQQILVHGSAVRSPTSGTVVIGGTGGVGKTLLETHLCLRHGFGFVADDIVVLSVAGQAWPNLAYPKIYGYNVLSDPELQRRVMSSRSLADRAHWMLHSHRGANKVRRRMSPSVLYSDVPTEVAPLTGYVFLVRESRQGIDIQAATASTMATLTTKVIQAEYASFFQHLTWHELNAHIAGLAPRVELARLLEGLEHRARATLEGVPSFVVRIPDKAPLESLRTELADLVKGISGAVS